MSVNIANYLTSSRVMPMIDLPLNHDRVQLQKASAPPRAFNAQGLTFTSQRFSFTSHDSFSVSPVVDDKWSHRARDCGRVCDVCDEKT